MTDRYAVVGNPIAHSKSPAIHSQFAEQTEQDLSYEKLLVELGDFNRFVNQFFADGGKGLNVTVPFKEEAWALSQVKTPRAEKAGAVNTLWFANGKIHGDNTDGAGMVRDISVNNGVSFADKSVLILGAGGAVRGVILPVLEENPSALIIANRTVSKAEALAKLFDADNISACGYDALKNQQFDVIINGTSAGLSGQLPPLPKGVLKPGGTTYDMVYADSDTAFVTWGKQHGASNALDGLGMLVEQAAESFYQWRGKRPNTDTTISQLRG